MIFSEALQSKAFSGHQTANSAAALNDPLGAGGIQRMGKGFSNPPPFGVATGITELDGISGSRLLVALLCGLLNEQPTGQLGAAVGQSEVRKREFSVSLGFPAQRATNTAFWA